MTKVRFPVGIGEGGIEVVVEVTDEEYKRLIEILETMEKINNGEDEDDELEWPEFEMEEELADLYQRIIETALDDAANGAADNPLPELEDEEYDFHEVRSYIEENYKIYPDFPESLDEE